MRFDTCILCKIVRSMRPKTCRIMRFDKIIPTLFMQTINHCNMEQRIPIYTYDLQFSASSLMEINGLNKTLLYKTFSVERFFYRKDLL